MRDWNTFVTTHWLRSTTLLHCSKLTNHAISSGSGTRLPIHPGMVGSTQHTYHVRFGNRIGGRSQVHPSKSSRRNPPHLRVCHECKYGPTQGILPMPHGS